MKIKYRNTYIIEETPKNKKYDINIIERKKKLNWLEIIKVRKEKRDYDSDYKKKIL